MSWATQAIERLRSGESVTIRPVGDSMVPRIRSRATVTVEPPVPGLLQRGDVVLVTVSGRDYLHLISATTNDRVQISNNRGGINGWVARERVHGVATRIDNSTAR